MKKEYNDTTYISWLYDAKKINLEQEEFTEFYNSLDKNKRVVSKTKMSSWIAKGDGAWRYDKEGDIEKIYYRKQAGEWIIYFSNCFDNTKNNHQVSKYDIPIKPNGNRQHSKTSFQQDFQKMFNTTMKKAYDTVEEDFKKFIPKQFYYNFVKNYLHDTTGENNYRIKGASSIDFCSMYPSNACGIMPDANTRVDVDEFVKPTEEYPFAFYPDTGHLAIYGEFDTHNWKFSKFTNYVFRTELNIQKEYRKFLQSPYKGDTRTILMKASNIDMRPLWEDYYKKRKKNDGIKMKMNSTIGKWHRKNYRQDKYAHLAAIVIARSNNVMLQIVNDLPIEHVIQICVDGLIYKGANELGRGTKALGSIYQEFTNCEMVYRGQNQYIVAKDGIVIKHKNAGYNYYKDGTPIREDNVYSLDDINYWEKVENNSNQRVKEGEEFICQQEDN